jgi:hypothetical protein
MEFVSISPRQRYPRYLQDRLLDVTQMRPEKSGETFLERPAHKPVTTLTELRQLRCSVCVE